MSLKTGFADYAVTNNTLSPAQMLTLQSQFEARLLAQDKKIADLQEISAEQSKFMQAMLEKKIEASAGVLKIRYVDGPNSQDSQKSQDKIDEVIHKESLMEKKTVLSIENLEYGMSKMNKALAMLQDNPKHLEYGMSQLQKSLAMFQDHPEMLPQSLRKYLPVESEKNTLLLKDESEKKTLLSKDEDNTIVKKIRSHDADGLSQGLTNKYLVPFVSTVQIACSRS